jgi:hypothetical protein
MDNNLPTEIYETIKTDPESEKAFRDLLETSLKAAYDKSKAARRFNEEVLGIKYPDFPPK